MRKVILVIGLISLCLSGYAQDEVKELCGKYKDGLGDMVITELVLKEDSTFSLTTPDPIFPYTYKKYTNNGRWILDGNSIRLNGDLKSRKVKIEMKETQIDSRDSITIKVNYTLEEYENEELDSSKPFEFDMLTLKLNGKKKAYNLRHGFTFRGCLFTPKVKNQLILDSLNTVKIPRRDIESLSVFSYGFDKFIVLKIENEKSNYIEISITQPVDRERMPRDKEVIVKDGKAFYYERNGKIVTSGMLSPLEKEN